MKIFDKIIWILLISAIISWAWYDRLDRQYEFDRRIDKIELKFQRLLYLIYEPPGNKDEKSGIGREIT